MVKRRSKPDWLKVRHTVGENFREVRNIVRQHHLHTVCEEARCPNQSECWERRAATFMILGDVCTRNCRFCAVTGGGPLPADSEEPEHVARAVGLMGLKYCVITSVTRDDLEDGGAAIWAATIRAVKEQNPDCLVEVLVPDFQGHTAAIDLVLSAAPDVFGHNLETVCSLYSIARPQADYNASLAVLRYASERGALTKTGIMVGLGESREQVRALMRDARDAGCEVFTAGQYLQPTHAHLPVARYVHPDEFAEYENYGRQIGFREVVAGPLVRSSYHADQLAGYIQERKQA